MSTARIIWAITLLAAIVFAFASTGYNGTILGILGVVSGWFVQKEHRLGLVIAALFLLNNGAGALNGVEMIGPHLTTILESIGHVMGAAAIVAILRRVVERIMPNKEETTG